MKSTPLFAAAMVFLIPALAFAGQKNSASVDFVQPVKVAGTQLAPGSYKLVWEGNGPEVTVSFMAGKKTVATAPAKLVNDRNNQPGAIETDTAKDNTVTLQAVDLKNVTIQFNNVVAAAGN
jgi:hypothetical protein